MERNSEGKRGSFAAVNRIGLSRPRHRITALRDSPEEEGKMETVRLRERERVHKVDRVGDRDQELMNQRKRRRMGRKRDVEGGCAGDEDSCGPSGEDNYEEVYEGPSSSMSNHVLCKTVTPIRNVRSISVSRIVDEMVGVLVPRKARSASVKRLNEQWISSPCGFGERQTRRRISQSPLGGSVDIVSPSSAIVSLRRKMQKPLGPKGLISKVSRKPLPSVEDDIEIEVVEALFDLMKQSHSLTQSQSFKKDESIRGDISTENLDLIGNDDFRTKSVHSLSISGQIGPKAPDLPREINSTSTSDLNTENESRFGKLPFDAPESAEEVSLEKGKDSCEPTQESVGGNQAIVPKEEESGSCENSGGDGSLDSRMLKANLASEVVMPSTKGEAKFEIDLMAPPPIPSSPDQDGSKTTLHDLKLDLEKSEQENMSSCSCSYNNSQQRGPEEPDNSRVSDSKRQNFGQLTSLPSPVVVTGWPGTFPPPGCISPLKTLLPVVESSGTTTSLIPPFTLSQPRPKRCVTHQYIACNIRQNQQLSKNCALPPATAHASLHEAKPSSGNPTNSSLNSFLGNALQGDLPGRHALATPSILSVKGKSSEVANADATKSKRLVPQQTLDQAPTSNLLQPALTFPLGQHQVANATAQQPGLKKSVGVMSKVALSSNSAGLPVIGSLSLPARAAAMSFNCANHSASDASRFMTILQGNVHPYSTSTNSGMSLPIRGAQAPVFPFLSASYYPSMFCTPQNQQKQSTCQPQSKPLFHVQQASSTAGTCSGSKSSYKQSKSHQQIVPQSSSHNSFGSEGLQLQQSQKQHVLGSHSSIKFVDSPGSRAQKASNAQNYRIPFQTLDFAQASHGEGNQRQLGSEHSVAVIPSQAIGFSFDLNTSTKKGFNFSASPQETAVQMLSDVSQLGYQFVPSAQVAQHKNFQVAEKRNVFDSINTDKEKKPLTALNFSKLLDSGNLSASARENIALDGSAQYQSSLPPPTTRNQSFSSSSPTATFSVTVSKSQQEQQQKETIQLQKQCTQEKQVTSSAQVQAPISNNYNYSFIGCNNPNNDPIFPLVHNNFVQSLQWKNVSFATTAQVPSLATTSSLKNLPQQQSRNSQGQPHVSFESSLNSAMLLQGQQFIINSKPASSTVDGHLEVAT